MHTMIANMWRWYRKLSGAFLLASRLNASVDCRALWTKVVEGYHYS